MNAEALFESVCEAMSDPGFYPHAVTRLECRRTHISVVFLTGEVVYKLKRPVNLGFLDFRTLEDRRRFCRSELELNKRLSSGVYLDTVDIFEGPGGFTLAPGGKPVECAVRMVQLPEAASLASLLAAGSAGEREARALGGVLAGFYAEAERGPHIDVFGDPEHIRTNMEENFAQMTPFEDLLPDIGKWEFARQVARTFLAGHEGLFARRIRDGRIRDGHGDLRAEHVYFHEGIQIIDCIEFNQRFRYGDSALDLSFLLMDLDRLGHPSLGPILADSYARTASDPEVYALLDFYASYRAVVRLKVACMSLGQAAARAQAKSEIGQYLDLAYRYAVSFGRPTLWVFCGLPASGKSTLAELASRVLSAPLLQSDALRKRAGEGEVVPYDTGMYRPILRGRVYAELLNQAQDHLRAGRSAMLDATFSDSRWREAAACLAEDMDVTLLFVECACPVRILRARLAAREGGASDARLVHLEDMVENFAPFAAAPPHTHIRVDTSSGTGDCLHEVLARACLLRRAQVRDIVDRLEGRTLSV